MRNAPYPSRQARGYEAQTSHGGLVDLVYQAPPIKSRPAKRPLSPPRSCTCSWKSGQNTPSDSPECANMVFARALISTFSKMSSFSKKATTWFPEWLMTPPSPSTWPRRSVCYSVTKRTSRPVSKLQQFILLYSHYCTSSLLLIISANPLIRSAKEIIC